MTKSFSAIGARIQSARQHRGIAQRELAEKVRNMGASVTRDMIANYETGRTELPIRYVSMIAHVLNVEINEIVPPLPKETGGNSPVGKTSNGTLKKPMTPISNSTSPNLPGEEKDDSAKIRLVRRQDEWSLEISF